MKDTSPTKPREEPAAKKEELGALSEVDREYINMLLELGYTKEAEEELRKRSSK